MIVRRRSKSRDGSVDLAYARARRGSVSPLDGQASEGCPPTFDAWIREESSPSVRRDSVAEHRPRESTAHPFIERSVVVAARPAKASSGPRATRSSAAKPGRRARRSWGRADTPGWAAKAAKRRKPHT